MLQSLRIDPDFYESEPRKYRLKTQLVPDNDPCLNCEVPLRCRPSDPRCGHPEEIIEARKAKERGVLRRRCAGQKPRVRK